MEENKILGGFCSRRLVILLAKASICCLIFVSWAPWAQATEQKVSKFNIHGIELGMLPENVKKVFPQISFTEFNDHVRKNDPRRFSGGAGTGWGMISDWNVNVYTSSLPYGTGAFYIHYKKFFNQRVDGATFSNTFKNDLIAKYGAPAYKSLGKDNSFVAFWGSGVDRDIINTRLHDTYSQYQAVEQQKLPNGHFLLATFENNPILQEIKMTLFDTNPYFVQVDVKKKREVERGQEKVKF